MRYPATVSYRKPSLTSNAARLCSYAKRGRGAGPALSRAIPTSGLEQSSSSARRKRRQSRRRAGAGRRCSTLPRRRALRERGGAGEREQRMELTAESEQITKSKQRGERTSRQDTASKQKSPNHPAGERKERADGAGVGDAVGVEHGDEELRGKPERGEERGKSAAAGLLREGGGGTVATNHAVDSISPRRRCRFPATRGPAGQLWPPELDGVRERSSEWCGTPSGKLVHGVRSPKCSAAVVARQVRPWRGARAMAARTCAICNYQLDGELEEEAAMPARRRREKKTERQRGAATTSGTAAPHTAVEEKEKRSRGGKKEEKLRHKSMENQHKSMEIDTDREKSTQNRARRSQIPGQIEHAMPKSPAKSKPEREKGREQCCKGRPGLAGSSRTTCSSRSSTKPTSASLAPSPEQAEAQYSLGLLQPQQPTVAPARLLCRPPQSSRQAARGGAGRGRREGEQQQTGRER
nr:unnamed protein product [Digitaria exilis]